MKKMCILNHKEFEALSTCIDLDAFEEIKGQYDECDEVVAPPIVEKMQQNEVQNHLFHLIDTDNNDDIILHSHRDEAGDLKHDYILIFTKSDMLLLAELTKVFAEEALQLSWMRLAEEEKKVIFSLRDKLNDATF